VHTVRVTRDCSNELKISMTSQKDQWDLLAVVSYATEMSPS
jgi:hypothetical protein